VTHIHIIRGRLFALTMIACVLLLGSVGLAAWAVASEHNAAMHQRLENCLVGQRDTETLRRLLVFFRARLRSESMTPGQSAAIDGYFRDALKQIPVPSCP
jgi:hypothetical protein